ncbi:MAG: NAD(P)-dependent oxidoreductase [Thermodesulfobacteriota bacterium]
MARIGCVGLGQLGGTMARRLREAGHEILVWNRSPARVAELGFPGAATPRELAQAVEKVVICLRDSGAVAQVLAGPTGLLARDLAGRLLVDFTTHDSQQVVRFHEEVAAAGGRYLETPVAGSVEQLAQGQVALFVSGSKADHERGRALLADLATDQFFLGPAGRATAMKLVNNLVLGGFTAILAEALLLAQGAGVSGPEAVRLLARGAGDSVVLTAMGQGLAAGDFSGTFSAALLHKDLTCLARLAAAQGQTPCCAPLVTDLYEGCRELGLEGKDFGAVLAVLRQRMEGLPRGGKNL